MRYILFYIILMLSACASIKQSTALYGRTNQYLTAKSISPLKIPPGLSSDTVHNYYPVSEKSYPESVKSVSVLPPGLYSSGEVPKRS